MKRPFRKLAVARETLRRIDTPALARVAAAAEAGSARKPRRSVDYACPPPDSLFDTVCNTEIVCDTAPSACDVCVKR